MKKIFSAVILIALATTGLILNSCESKTYEEISGKEIPTYTSYIAPLFSTTCTSCHSGGSQSPDLDNYADVKEATEKGNLICRIDDQSCGSVMPQSGRLPQSTIDKIKLWRDQGFVN
jgi:hypothetical protein